jgi:hypothetical protein
MNLNVTPDYSAKSKSRAGSAKRSKGADVALKKAKDEIREIRKSREDFFKKSKDEGHKKIKLSKVAVKPRDLDLMVQKDTTKANENSSPGQVHLTAVIPLNLSEKHKIAVLAAKKDQGIAEEKKSTFGSELNTMKTA